MKASCVSHLIPEVKKNWARGPVGLRLPIVIADEKSLLEGFGKVLVPVPLGTWTNAAEGEEWMTDRADKI